MYKISLKSDDFSLRYGDITIFKMAAIIIILDLRLLCMCRLVRQAPTAMSGVCIQWASLVYPLLLHPNPKLRDRAVLASDTLLPVMMAQQSDVAKCLASDLKDVRPLTFNSMTCPVIQR